MHPIMMEAYVHFAKHLHSVGYSWYAIVKKLYFNGVNELYYRWINTRSDMADICDILRQSEVMDTYPSHLRYRLKYDNLYRRRPPSAHKGDGAEAMARRWQGKDEYLDPSWWPKKGSELERRLRERESNVL